MVYNLDKGGNTLKESEILEPLHACVRELLERDRLGKSHLIEYSDDDVIAATLLYVHILSNRYIHNLNREKVNLRHSREQVNSYVQMINNITRAMTKVNVKAYYKKRDDK